MNKSIVILALITSPLAFAGYTEQGDIQQDKDQQYQQEKDVDQDYTQQDSEKYNEQDYTQQDTKGGYAQKAPEQVCTSALMAGLTVATNKYDNGMVMLRHSERKAAERMFFLSMREAKIILNQEHCACPSAAIHDAAFRLFVKASFQHRTLFRHGPGDHF